jgi:hypothetical protein
LSEPPATRLPGAFLSDMVPSRALLCWLTGLLLLVAGCDTVRPDPSRNFAKSVERIFDNPFEASLIEAAENAYPDRERVVAARPDDAPIEIPETGYWYYDVVHDVLVPYAITGSAVAYYDELLDAVAARTSHRFISHAFFAYRARVSFEERFEGPVAEGAEPPEEQVFENVHVVDMELEWSHFCGFECAVTIEARRMVIFDESGSLLRIFLDGPHQARQL